MRRRWDWLMRLIRLGQRTGPRSVHLVRQNILEILKESSGATVAELAERLNMAPVSVRHHLDILQGDNLICVDGLARTGAVGRPQQVYALTEDANRYFPDNFAALASGLLRQLRDLLPPDRFESALRSMAREFAAPAASIAREDAPNGDPVNEVSEERMDAIVHFLNERGYLARWERRVTTGGLETGAADESVFFLHKCNCPYADISADHHELCIMDQALVDELVGRHCERVRSIAADEACCSYRIVLSESETAALQRSEPTTA